MSSTAGTERAATSEQPARSPAKARKYNFGKPGVFAIELLVADLAVIFWI